MINRLSLPLSSKAGLGGSLLCGLLLAGTAHADAVHPAVMTAEDQTGKIFEHPDAVVKKADEGYILEFTSMMSSDGHFGAGMYDSGPAVEVYTEEDPYGYDEFMYFLEGGVTLTSSDGTVTEIKAGDAVTISKEWVGTWKTQGYRKIWVFYSDDPDSLD